MIIQKQIEEIVKRIVDNYKPEKIILFGSYAYGIPTKDSDLDLLIVKNSSLPRHKRAREEKGYFIEMIRYDFIPKRYNILESPIHR